MEQGRKELFKTELGKVEMIEGKVQEIWEEFGRVKDTMEKVEKNRGRERGRKNGGQHEECRRKKREIRRGLKVWRKELEKRQEYRRKKREYKELCERKRQEENERWEREAEEARMEE